MCRLLKYTAGALPWGQRALCCHHGQAGLCRAARGPQGPSVCPDSWECAEDTGRTGHLPLVDRLSYFKVCFYRKDQKHTYICAILLFPLDKCLEDGWQCMSSVDNLPVICLCVLYHKLKCSRVLPMLLLFGFEPIWPVVQELSSK